jgi:hypothetical protein
MSKFPDWAQKQVDQAFQEAEARGTDHSDCVRACKDAYEFCEPPGSMLCRAKLAECIGNCPDGRMISADNMKKLMSRLTEIENAMIDRK